MLRERVDKLFARRNLEIFELETWGNGCSHQRPFSALFKSQRLPNTARYNNLGFFAS
jgi:hypothetical protein